MMLRNLLIVSMVVFLTTVTTAPVEEKEEVEPTEEGEGELSEEEEDDDDSKSQDKIEGIPGVQQTTTVAAAGGSGSRVSEPAVQSSSISTSPTHAAGASRTDTEYNGQKLLNGGRGGGGGMDSQTGLLGSPEGASHLDHTGIVHPSAHDFLLGLMGAGPFISDVHVTVPVINSDVTAPPPVDQKGSSSLDSPADSVHQSDISIDQSGQSHISLTSGPDQSLSSSLSGSSDSHSAAQEASSHSEDQREQTGNGRQNLLINNGAVTNQQLPLSERWTDVTDGAEAVTNYNRLTETPPLVFHTDSVDTPTMTSAPDVSSHTDLVAMTTGFPGETVTGTPPDSSHLTAMDHTQTAGPVTEQYNPSGQGPEGAENVELEDTC
ncbi:uncharacterized protein LOC115050685 isoform X3 [Echeneis naucrates]|uniref:uncharacterized protein LOC115050685 isoform X3 n=1 Tax=Echeneis naucrates TaxID=173247 RepID=UPI0011139133|nr:uncharacterized protein LOC115050685 isoform X3 [Echeneis naucrates]